MSNRKLYDNPLSGHSHRPRALLGLLQLDYENVFIDFSKGEHKSAAILELNPLGELPIFVEGDVVLRESTAILVYLSLKYDPQRTWLPEDPQIAAEIQSWLSVSSKEMFEGPFAARVAKLFGAPIDHAAAVAKSDKIFSELFEPRLAKNDWLVGDTPTIADIANYGYIAAAHEGEIDLSAYPNIEAWLKRLEAIEGFEKMPAAKDILG